MNRSWTVGIVAALIVFLVAGGLLVVGCNTSNPVAPPPPGEGDPGGGSGGGGGNTPGPSCSDLCIAPSSGGTTLETNTMVDLEIQVALGAQETSAQVQISTSLGSFGNDSSGQPIQQRAVAVTGNPGQVATASVTFSTGATPGTANVLAQKDTLVRTLSLQIQMPANLVLQAVSPTSGAAAGGTRVTLTGGGFDSSLEVTFGGVSASLAAGTTVTSTRAEVISPAANPPPSQGSSKTVDVQVTVGKGTANQRQASLTNAFTYLLPNDPQGPTAPPLIAQVVPTGGPNEGGTVITISGSGFVPSSSGPESQVFFGIGAGQGNFQKAQVTGAAVTETAITVTQPPAQGAFRFLLNRTIDIQVINPGSGLSDTANSVFTYGGGGSLLVNDVQPRQASYTGNVFRNGQVQPVSVTITGQGFGTSAANLQVEIAGVAQTLASTVSQTSITVPALAPAPVSGCNPPQGPVVVVNTLTGERGTSPFNFRYTAPVPSLGGVSPATVPEAGGAVTVSGSGFTNDAASVAVELGGVRGAVTGVTADPSDGLVASAIAVTAPAFGGTFDQESCDDNGDGVEGVRNLPTAVDVQVFNTDTGCTSSVLRDALSYEPSDTDCREAPVTLTADFDFAVTTNADGDPCVVLFFDRSDGPVATYAWDFGDPKTGLLNFSTAPNPRHDYTGSGPAVYSVSLLVTDAGGDVTDTIVKPVDVSGCPVPMP